MCSNTTETRKIVHSMEAKFCFEQVYWVEAQRGNSTCVGDGGIGVKKALKDLVVFTNPPQRENPASPTSVPLQVYWG